MPNKAFERLADKLGSLPENAAVPVAELKTELAKVGAEMDRQAVGAGVGRVGLVPDVDSILSDTEARMKSADAFTDGLMRMGPERRRALAAATEKALSGPSLAHGQLSPSVASEVEYALRSVFHSEVHKAGTTTGVTTGTGLVPYALDFPAYMLYPVLTPLRNSTKRTVVGGTQKNYKRITGIDSGNDYGFVAEATSSTSGRSSYVNVTEDDKNVAFKLLGADMFLTTLAQFGGRSTIDGADFKPEQVSALAGLQAMMMRGEWAMLGANGGAALGKPTGLAAAATQFTGGSLTAATQYDFKVSALNLLGVKLGSKGHTSADAVGETDGSTLAAITTAASAEGSKSVALTWNSVAGAVAYNVYAGTHGGTLYYVGTYYNTGGGTSATGTNVVIVSSIPGSGGVPNTSDQTQDANAYTGLISLVSLDSSAGYRADNLAAGFTGDSTTGVKEFDQLFLGLWENYRLSPTKLLMNARDAKAASKIILGSAAPVFRVNLEDGASTVRGSIMATSQLNPYIGNGVGVEFVVHPYLPRGTVIALCENLGQYYPMPGVPNPWEMLMGFDAMRIDFAQTGLKRENGVYEYGAPALYFPGAFGVIRNTGN